MNNGGIKINNSESPKWNRAETLVVFEEILDSMAKWLAVAGHDWNCGVCQQHADWIQNNLGMGLERVSVIAMLQEYWAKHIEKDKHDD